MLARFYQQLESGKVKCLLCPHECVIQEGKFGICRIRANVRGELVADAYRKYSAVSFDPVEKKPLYHYYPGKEILSVGSVGCNMRCRWCQNCDISQQGIRGNRSVRELSPRQILEIAGNRTNNIGIAFTYNEPLINFESNIEIAELSAEKGLKNVMVTNGFFSEPVLLEYLRFIDAFNVDVKAFEDKVCRKFTGAPLAPVLKNLELIKKHNKHLELTYLLIPGVNDTKKSFVEFIDWITKNTGSDTILHISRYFPRYQMNNNSTPEDELLEFADIAYKKLSYVYLGNTTQPEYKDTYCPGCGNLIIERNGYFIRVNEDVKHGKCPECSSKVFISE